jgi:hypothetical protein
MRTLHGAGVLAAILALAASAFGQNVISAHSGLIYYFDGSVYLDNQPLQADPGRFQNVEPGAELRTEDGRAEVLLTPGVFLRIGENSSIRIVDNDLAHTLVEIESGSAIMSSDEPASGTSVTLSFRSWRIRAPHAGTYRIDSDPPELWAVMGDVEVESNAGSKPLKVAEGMELSFGDSLQPEPSTGIPNDSLTEWAKGRDQSIIADDSITQQLGNDAVSQIAPDGFDRFPPLGLYSYGYGDPYASTLPAQPGFYSPYFPGYVYFPPIIVFPLRGVLGIPGRLPPGSLGVPGFLPGTGTGVRGAGGVGMIQPPVGLPRPVIPRPGSMRPVMPTAPVGAAPRPAMPAMPSHPITHPMAPARGAAAGHAAGHR